jgi:cation transport regulator ChaC
MINLCIRPRLKISFLFAHSLLLLPILLLDCITTTFTFLPPLKYPFQPTLKIVFANQPKMTTTTTEEQEDGAAAAAVWCPAQQIYIGGVIPGATNEQVEELLAQNDGYLRVFGYGSLCWNPGSADTALGHDSVTSSLGHALHYKRAWAQKSTDHRGTPEFPGIVCTLLQAKEVEALLPPPTSSSSDRNTNMMTEGMIYLVPPKLAQDCLTELDFREKGGYAREIINVIEDATGKTYRTLLYRGTPDNPAFWSRLVWDLPLAAGRRCMRLCVYTPPKSKPARDRRLIYLFTFPSSSRLLLS